MMKSETLLAKNNIANRPSFQKYQCSICYELALLTHQCSGPCHKPFCLKCVGRIKHDSQNYCPNKCSTPFETVPIPGFSVQFQCPYQPQNCDKIFATQKQFQKHCEECKFITVSAKKQVLNRKEFRCEKGHQLLIITDEILDGFGNSQASFYRTVMNDLCVGCSSRNLCRGICLTCSSNKHRHIYCIQCRKLPLDRKSCPIGHEWIKKMIPKNNFGSVCDVCGLAGSLVGNCGYVEHDCDIFICQPCYANLPNKKIRKKLWKYSEPAQNRSKSL